MMARRWYNSESKRLKIYRSQAYIRQRGLCFWCKQPVKKTDATADHLCERKAGGLTARGNIVMACAPCNNSRSNPPPSHDAHVAEWVRVRLASQNITISIGAIGKWQHVSANHTQ